MFWLNIVFVLLCWTASIELSPHSKGHHGDSTSVIRSDQSKRGLENVKKRQMIPTAEFYSYPQQQQLQDVEDEGDSHAENKETISLEDNIKGDIHAENKEAIPLEDNAKENASAENKEAISLVDNTKEDVSAENKEIVPLVDNTKVDSHADSKETIPLELTNNTLVDHPEDEPPPQEPEEPSEDDSPVEEGVEETETGQGKELKPETVTEEADAGQNKELKTEVVTEETDAGQNKEQKTEVVTEETDAGQNKELKSETVAGYENVTANNENVERDELTPDETQSNEEQSEVNQPPPSEEAVDNNLDLQNFAQDYESRILPGDLPNRDSIEKDAGYEERESAAGGGEQQQTLGLDQQPIENESTAEEQQPGQDSDRMQPVNEENVSPESSAVETENAAARHFISHAHHKKRKEKRKLKKRHRKHVKGTKRSSPTKFNTTTAQMKNRSGNSNTTKGRQALVVGGMPPNYKPLYPPIVSKVNATKFKTQRVPLVPKVNATKLKTQRAQSTKQNSTKTNSSVNTKKKSLKNVGLQKQKKKKTKKEAKSKKGKSSKNKFGKLQKMATKNERGKQRKVGECHDYLGCLESWFERYRVRVTPSLNTVDKLKGLFSDIFKNNFLDTFKSEIKDFVGNLSEMRLINWAIIYDYRPKFATWMNIEFLRMPLGIEIPANLKETIIFKRIEVVKEKQDDIKDQLQSMRNDLQNQQLFPPIVNVQAEIKGLQQKYDFLGQSLRNMRDNSTITKTYQKEAPALSVSGFDRSSYIWSRCAPKDSGDSTNDLFVSMYQTLMDLNSYQCALFAFMKCVRDMESDKSLSDYLITGENRRGSFERYQKGFRSLIQLHYDYGAKQNKLLPINPKTRFASERLTSAYCESPVKVSCLQEDGMTKEESIRFEQSYYCQNFFGCFITCGEKCFLRERNLLPDEKDRLVTWLSGDKKSNKAENELWSECCANVQNCMPLKSPAKGKYVKRFPKKL